MSYRASRKARVLTLKITPCRRLKTRMIRENIVDPTVPCMYTRRKKSTRGKYIKSFVHSREESPCEEDSKDTHPIVDIKLTKTGVK